MQAEILLRIIVSSLEAKAQNPGARVNPKPNTLNPKIYRRVTILIAGEW